MKRILRVVFSGITQWSQAGIKDKETFVFYVSQSKKD